MPAEEVFDAIQPLLVDGIPKAIGSVKHETPICIVRVYYYDTHAPCTYLDFRCVSVLQREQTIKSKGKDGLDYLWSSGEECGTRPNVSIPSDPDQSQIARTLNVFGDRTDAKIAKLFAKVYRLLGDDEDEYMPSFRAALQSVTMKLNQTDWQQVCEVTDDFVVVPADGSMFFCDDEADLIGGVPAERIALLQSRGFLGPSNALLSTP
jgi:hypothetical protein